MKKIAISLLVIAPCLIGCQKYYISIVQDEVDKNSLASSSVHTPDPRQSNPPMGDRLIVEWQLPKDLLGKQPCLRLYVLYKNYTEELFVYPIAHRTDYIAYTLSGEEYKQKKGILTYRAQVCLEDGEVFRDWKHQLWAKLITVEQEEEALVPEDKIADEP